MLLDGILIIELSNGQFKWLTYFCQASSAYLLPACTVLPFLAFFLSVGLAANSILITMLFVNALPEPGGGSPPN